MSRNDIKKRKERRTITSSIGYCFVIVLIVLLVMSSVVTNTYTTILKSERAEAMEALVVSESAALGHYPITPNMTYPMPIYNYDDDSQYTVNIYTKGGNSFLRVYSSVQTDSSEQYYLSGVGDEYNNCFELKQETFTTRDENGVKYACAIAPIISAKNTVAGVLEISMPYSDFESTVNGMSLSWMLTIFAIAISMGIIIFELNLFVSTLSKGISPNVPILIMYGEGAIRFLSFFMAFGAVIPVLVISDIVKTSLGEYGSYVVQVMIALGLVLYALGFFGFSSLRKQLKYMFTGRIAVFVSTGIGYLLSLAVGIANNLIVTFILILPIAFCYGMSFDSLRDYRINAGKLGYSGFDDRTIHKIQTTGYFLGVSVGAVIGGICFERYGILIVNIISGAAIILTALGIVFFMKENVTVKESYLPVNKWLELVSDKFAGRFLVSTFFVMGIIVSFLLGFIPNYLDTVGISLATSSFYYLIAAFSGCFVAQVINGRYAGSLTSRIRVVISSLCAFIGFLLFALLPTAKIMFITVLLLGISLGIHDYYYLYVLFLLTEGRVKANLRKAAELSFVAGIVAAIPVFALAFIFDMRIVLIIGLIVFFICAFIYPMSAYSNNVDDRDPSVKKKAKTKKVKEEPAPQPAPAVDYQPEPVYEQMPEPVPAVDQMQNYYTEQYENSYVDPYNQYQQQYPDQYDNQDANQYSEPYADQYQQPYNQYGNDDAFNTYVGDYYDDPNNPGGYV